MSRKRVKYGRKHPHRTTLSKSSKCPIGVRRPCLFLANYAGNRYDKDGMRELGTSSLVYKWSGTPGASALVHP